MLEKVKDLLTHPLACNLDIDSPETTEVRIKIIESKPFLVKIYQDWYKSLIDKLPNNNSQPVLEIGSGAGFLKKEISNSITSDILHLPTIDLVLNAHNLPLAHRSLQAILMVNVLHHIPDVEKFFKEALRCVSIGGKVAMIEPWITPWSKWVYTKLHHEPLDTETESWKFPEGGALSQANSALPWILFHRDRELFENKFPQWEIEIIHPIMPFRYLISGGVSLRNLMPEWTSGFWKGFESLLTPWNHKLAMFAIIILKRIK